MFFNSFPRVFYDAETGGASGAQNEQSTENNTKTTDFEALLKDVNIDELLKHGPIAKKIQSIADSRVSEGIKTAKAKWEQEQQEQQDEATKLAKMTQKEREEYQFKKDKAEFEAQKKAFEHSQLQVETAKQLISAGLPDLSEWITGENAEKTKENIAALTKVLGAWKADALKDAMRGKGQRDTNGGETPTITQKEFNKMSYGKRVELYQKDPELYRKLANKS